MGIEEQVVYTLVCDVKGCCEDIVFEEGVSMEEATIRKRAAKDGWSYANYMDFCPDHTAANNDSD